MKSLCKKCGKNSKMYGGGYCKICYYSAKQVAKYKKDPEFRKKVNLASVNFRKQNPGYYKEYWKNNPDKYEIFKAKAREYNKLYRERNKESIREKEHKYYLKNKGRLSKLNLERYHKKKNENR